ncbi:MAG: DUF2336 domain-containing protein [Rickettsiales bacterium]|nr:DUF2336 domain-containing protein [Rickettsiales bacterium]
MNLTATDLKDLTQDSSGQSKLVLAKKLASEFTSGQFSEGESDIAIDIFRLLLRDAHKQVRRALAEHLSMSPRVPHDIIVKLAADDADVSIPVLEHSAVLTESDLLSIIESTKEILKLCAVARRENLSERVADTLLDTKEEEVLTDLFLNKTAKISESGIERVWEYVAEKRSLLETLVHRGNLPLTVAEKIYFVVSDEMKTMLTRQYKIKTPLANKVSSDSREWQLLGIIPSDGMIDPNSDDQVEDLIDQLYYGGRLTHSFLMRALCVGSLSIFEAGIARLAGVPRVNARILLMDSGELGAKAIYEAAAMPPGFADAVGVLLRISLEETDFGLAKRTDFRKRVIDRIYQEGYHRTVDNMQYLLAIIGGKLVPAAA